jgi:predicted AAA+ superfamily ATPase
MDGSIKRKALEDLCRWKDKERRKPLIIQGARQVGKTHLMREFGRMAFKNTVYVNFDDSRGVQDLFAPNLDTKRIITSLEYEQHQKINPADTLIIFDEIQECNRALVSLKYFCENAPQYHIVAAGSFLGVAMHEGNSFPVGKVNMMTLYPLSFAEFLSALGEDGLAEAADRADFPVIAGFKNRFIELLKYYFFVGGMPEAVRSFSQDRNLEDVREIQNAIASNYAADFSKHIHAADIPKVKMLWESVPAQLAKEKKKFVYSDMRQGARSRDYENALNWLVSSGLVYQVNRVSLPNLPLISYKEREHFKLYMLDVGLLSAKAGLDIKTLLKPNADVFNHFRGALTEQFVLQEFKALDDSTPIFYWTNNKNSSEIDFVIQKWDEVIPVEVKSSINLKAKSLAAYMSAWKPRAAIRVSMADYARHDHLFDIPLYLAGKFERLLARV